MGGPFGLDQRSPQAVSAISAGARSRPFSVTKYSCSAVRSEWRRRSCLSYVFPSMSPHPTFSYRYEDVHVSTQTVSELVPGRRVVWHVDDARLSFTSEPDEWVGTDIRFEILPLDAATEVRFTHVGLTPRKECYEKCSGAWTFYVSNSLRSLITTGVGSPNPLA